MRALVAGANGEIGFAIVKYLLDEGYAVLAIDQSVGRLLSLSKNNNRLEILPVDLTCHHLLERYFSKNDEPFDVFVYAAGIREIMPMVSLSIPEWQRVLDINLTGAFLLSQQVISVALQLGAPLNIIYISSISGLFGEPERAAYCASKHGLIGLAKSQAIELAQYNIRVNVIAPGIIETDMTRPYQSDSNLMRQIKHNIPLKRWGLPCHIVQSVEMVIKNDYLTGSTLVVDGGWTAGKVL